MKSGKKPAKKPPLEKTIVGNVISQAKRMGWLPINMHGNQFSLKGLAGCSCRKGRDGSLDGSEAALGITPLEFKNTE